MSGMKIKTVIHSALLLIAGFGYAGNLQSGKEEFIDPSVLSEKIQALGLRDDTLKNQDKPVVWRCLNCGYLFEGTEAPSVCPACAHPQSYYEVLGENW